MPQRRFRVFLGGVLQALGRSHSGDKAAQSRLRWPGWGFPFGTGPPRHCNDSVSGSSRIAPRVSASAGSSTLLCSKLVSWNLTFSDAPRSFARIALSTSPGSGFKINSAPVAGPAVESSSRAETEPLNKIRRRRRSGETNKPHRVGSPPARQKLRRNGCRALVVVMRRHCG